MRLGPRQLRARARAVELLVLDVDGVLTDGGLYYGPAGEALKRFDVKDGHALVLAHLTGLRVAVLTARRSQIVQRRAAELWIDPVMQGFKDKRAGLAQLLKRTRVRPEAVAYVGDDINDLAPMEAVGLSACPADAAAEVRRSCHYLARARGGRGAVREIVELLLKAQGRWGPAVALMRAGTPPRG